MSTTVGENGHTPDGLRDPVCGMSVTRDSPHHTRHAGQDFWFCSARCRTRFEAAPEQFLAGGSDCHAHTAHAHRAPAGPVPAGTQYTCPMHPEILQDGPGTCPLCGMALEPLLPQLDEGENPELVDFRRRLLLTLPLTVAVMVLAMAGHYLPGLDAATRT